MGHNKKVISSFEGTETLTGDCKTHKSRMRTQAWFTLCRSGRSGRAKYPKDKGSEF